MNTDNVNFISEMVELDFSLPDDSVGVNLYTNPWYSAVTLENWNSLDYTPTNQSKFFLQWVYVINPSFLKTQKL